MWFRFPISCSAIAAGSSCSAARRPAIRITIGRTRAVGHPATYDRDLLRLFSDDPRHSRSPAASAFLRSHRAMIRQIVSKWTGEYQLTLDAVFDDMIGRCRELNLRAVGSERQLRMEFIVLLTAKTVHSLYSPSRRQWLAL